MSGLLLGHISHWYHLVLYVIPVVAVLVAIYMTGRAERRRADDAGPEQRGGDPKRR